jgi:hypothetical protein
MLSISIIAITHPITFLRYIGICNLPSHLPLHLARGVALVSVALRHFLISVLISRAANEELNYCQTNLAYNLFSLIECNSSIHNNV